MKPREIQSGCYYINESKGLVREIVAVRDDGYVQYFSYWLSDGVSDGILGGGSWVSSLSGGEDDTKFADGVGSGLGETSFPIHVDSMHDRI